MTDEEKEERKKKNIEDFLPKLNDFVTSIYSNSLTIYTITTLLCLTSLAYDRGELREKKCINFWFVIVIIVTNIFVTFSFQITIHSY